MDASVRVAVAAATLACAVLATHLVSPGVVSPVTIGLTGLGVLCGEALRASLPYRRGLAVRLAPPDAAVLAACVLARPAEVVLGALLGVLLWHVVDRLETTMLAVSIGQFTLTAAAATATFRLFVPAGTPLAPGMLLPYGLTALVVLTSSTVLVGAMLSRATGRSLRRAVRRVAAPNAVLVAGEACLALLAVGLIEDHAYLLPVVAVPMLFVMVASRQQAEAQLSQERSRALLGAQRALHAAVDRTTIDDALVDGIARLVHAEAAVWRDGHWVTPVPTGSAPLPGPALRRGRRIGQARDFGPAADGPAVAVAGAGGTVVAWGGDLGLVEHTEQWIERLVQEADGRAARTAAQAALEQERATLRRVVDGTSDGIYVLDGEGRVAMANPAMAALLGTALANILGHPVATALGPGRWDVAGVRDVVRPPDGIWRVAVAPIGDRSDGDVVGVVHDVTGERRLARRKDDMLAVVSHELRTPLTPIRAAAQLLRTRWHRIDEPTRETLLVHLADRAEHLTRVVEDLLLVAQLSADRGLPPLPLVDVDVAAALAGHVRRHDEQRADHEIVYEGPDSALALTDAGRLRQVVDHLLDNACKFSPPGTRVTVSLDVQGPTAVIRVRDAGRGIPASDVERIFERFERLEDPLVMQTSGTGLGLFIVASLVRALRGRLRVDSVVERGTTMTVELPLVEATARDARSRAAVPGA